MNMVNRINPLTQSDKKYTLTIIPVAGYELECYVLESTPHRPILYLRDTTIDQYHLATDFFSVNWEIDDIEEDILPTIHDIIEQGWGDKILSGQIVSVIIEPEKSFFTLNYERTKNLGEKKAEAYKDPKAHIDTLIFKAISEKWLSFLKNHQVTK